MRLRLGAKGYIMKHQAVENILSAIRRILYGCIYQSDDMHSLILERLRIPSFSPGSANLFACLTDRNFEVQRLTGFGFGPGRLLKNSTEPSRRTALTASKIWA